MVRRSPKNPTREEEAEKEDKGEEKLLRAQLQRTDVTGDALSKFHGGPLLVVASAEGFGGDIRKVHMSTTETWATDATGDVPVA